MLKDYIKKKIRKLIGFDELLKKQNLILKNFGLVNSKINKEKLNKNLNDYEFQIFSQFGDDGIIQYLIQELKIEDKTFIEFGVENYDEANTRLLLESFGWSGLVIDASKTNVLHIIKQDYYWRNNLNVACDFITKENINKILENNNFKKKIGILSIDIDGNDYWIWKEITNVDPSIVIVEYNARFGSENSVTIPYKENFNRMNTNFNNLYYGASLSALTKLAKEKNYSLIGTNSNGNNAYFIKNDLLPNEHNILKAKKPNECFNTNSFKEFRDKKNNIVSLTHEQELKILEKAELIKI